MIEWFVAPIAGGIVGFAVWYLQSRIDKIGRAQERLHDERRKIYSDVLEPFIRVFTGIKKPHEMDKAMKQVVSYEYRKAAIEFNFVGSDKVVMAFNDLMQHIYSTADEEERDASRLMLLWGQLLLAIRRSLGERRTGLSAVDMLRGQISDIDAFRSPSGNGRGDE